MDDWMAVLQQVLAELESYFPGLKGSSAEGP
jgi:hypothetical protein